MMHPVQDGRYLYATACVLCCPWDTAVYCGGDSVAGARRNKHSPLNFRELGCNCSDITSVLVGVAAVLMVVVRGIAGHGISGHSSIIMAHQLPACASPLWPALLPRASTAVVTTRVGFCEGPTARQGGSTE